jgi:hypothetical protein
MSLHYTPIELIATTTAPATLATAALQTRKDGAGHLRLGLADAIGLVVSWIILKVLRESMLHTCAYYV